MGRNGFSRIEAALLVGLAAAVLVSAAGVRTQAALSDKLLRLHVVANSDSAADQALKLAVRDRVLEEAERITAGAADAAEARSTAAAALPRLCAAAEAALREAGCGDSVTVSLDTEYFPTKRYGGFALPAGRYEALRVVIGEGRGQNWWCVLFPPFCTAAVFADTAAAAGLEPEEISFMRTEDGIELRFRLAEWIGWMREKLGNVIGDQRPVKGGAPSFCPK